MGLDGRARQGDDRGVPVSVFVLTREQRRAVKRIQRRNLRRLERATIREQGELPR